MKDEIRSYLLANGATDVRGPLDDHSSLLEAGVLDSGAMVDLITHLEQAYSIEVEEDDMIPENFDSIEAIALYVSRKQAESGTPPQS